MSAGHVCKACGTQGRPTLRSPSNFGVELLVWLGAIIVAAMSHWIVVLGALAFSLWRFAGRKRACAKCGSPDVIPLDTPLGRQISEAQKAPHA